MVDGRSAVILTELPDNHGQSVTNASEVIAAAAADRFGLDPSNTVFIEHYQVVQGDPEHDTFDFIEYRGRPGDTWVGGRRIGFLGEPRWSPAGRPAVEQLCGQPVE